MPTISKIRFTHVIYEGGNKRYNDEIFDFHGHNGAIVLENGGGKTVFIQTAIQAVLPHADLAGRKVKDTLSLDQGPAHIAIEWILNDKPRRRYALTCVSLFQSGTGIDSLRYVYEYGEHDQHALDHVPFVKPYMGKSRPADKGEMQDYYTSMEQRYPLNAKASFPSLKQYDVRLISRHSDKEDSYLNDDEGVGKMVEKRQSYNKEFREETVKYIQKSLKSLPEIAEEINIPVGTLGSWLGKYRKLEDEPSIANRDPSEDQWKLKEQEATIQSQDTYIKDLEEENAILKKAMHYFSKDRK
jgi:transposase-like protein